MGHVVFRVGGPDHVNNADLEMRAIVRHLNGAAPKIAMEVSLRLEVRGSRVRPGMGRIRMTFK